MTLPKLLFALGQKGVVLSEGKKGRLRFNPRGPVSPAMKAAIQEHKLALQELLRGGDVENWRRIRLRPRDDPEDGGEDGQFLDDDHYVEPDPDLVERWAMEDAEAGQDAYC